MSRHSALRTVARAAAAVGVALVLAGSTSPARAGANPSVNAGSSIMVPFTCKASALGIMVDVYGPDGAWDFVNWAQAGSAQEVVWNVPATWPGGQTRLEGTCTYDGPVYPPMNRYVDVAAAPVETTTSTTEAPTTTSTTEAPVETTTTTEAPVQTTTSTTAAPIEPTTSTTTAPATSTISTTAAPTSTTVPLSPPPADGALDLSDITWTPANETITAVATGYGEGSSVRFYLYSTPRELGSAVADANGVATLVVAVPADLPAGPHTVVSYGVDGTGATRVLAQQVTFAAPAAAGTASPAPASPAAGAQLPRTGSSSARTAAFGVALVLVGVALEALGRRRLAESPS